jgi:hypothetical protein
MWKSRACVEIIGSRNSAGRKGERKGDMIAPGIAPCRRLDPSWRVCDSCDANLRYAGDLPYVEFKLRVALERALSVLAAFRTKACILTETEERAVQQKVVAQGEMAK